MAELLPLVKAALFSGGSFALVAVRKKISKLMSLHQAMEIHSPVDLEQLHVACKALSDAPFAANDLELIRTSRPVQRLLGLDKQEQLPEAFCSDDPSARLSEKDLRTSLQKAKLCSAQGDWFKLVATEAGLVKFRGAVKGLLDSRRPVQSQLKAKVVGHLLKTYSGGKDSASNFLNGEDPVDKKTDWGNKLIELNKQINFDHDRKNELSKVLRDEDWNKEWAAVVIEKKHLNFTSHGYTRNYTYRLHYKNLQLTSGGAECNVDCLGDYYPKHEFKGLGKRGVTFTPPDVGLKLFLSWVVVLLVRLLEKKPRGSVLWWDFPVEENEFHIESGTPVTLIGNFVYKNAELRASKIDFLGENLHSATRKVSDSIWNWRLAEIFLGVALLAFGLREVNSWGRNRNEGENPST